MFTQLSHCAKIWYAYIFVDVQRQFCQTQIHGENITLILRSKVKVIQRLGMYATHRTMVIHSHAKHIMTMSKNKKAVTGTQSHIINLINLTSRSKINVSGS